uniref:RanBP2-type domain-containing protein n=1 Tax=Oryza barthii TaxID=65489 RepID=A0A0D3EVF3_9ORYZ
MGGASKLLSSLLLTSSPLRLRPSAGAFALFLSPPASRRHLLLSSPAPLRTLSTASASAAAGGASSDSYSSGSCHSPFPEWSRLVDRLSAAGYGARAPSPADELDLDPECGLSSDAEAAVSSFLAFARDRPDLLRSLPRKDVEVLVANAAPALFKDGEASELRLRQYLAGEGSDVTQSERAETIDIVRYLLSYAYGSPVSYLKDKELTDSAVRNILAEFVSFSGFPQTSSYAESTARQNTLGSRPPGQNIEMKRGDWICTRCSFMNFARNARCLECNEHRPKKMLTGGEWECPHCKRPGTIPPNPAGAGLDGVAQFLNTSIVGKSEIERKLAENDQKAERWLNKVSQLDDSADLSSLAADEDFPEIMPMRKGVNKFVVSTRKTPLERRLANAQYSSNNSPQDGSSDSKISKTLDRILGRSTSTSVQNNQSGDGDVNTSSNKTTSNLGGIDPVPFVPLSADQFAKPQNSFGDGQSDTQISTEADSMAKSQMDSMERRDDKRSFDTTEEWSKKVAELSNVKDFPSAISDQDFPEIMPMRKGENRFVISKKKDRSLTSPQYKRRSVLEHADNSNFIPFVPFPPDYFAKKNKPVENSSDAGIVPEGPPSAEKLPETKYSSGNLGNIQNSSQVMGSQAANNMNNENRNGNYPHQNLSTSGYGYGESITYQHQPQSQGMVGRSGGASETGTRNANNNQGSFSESRDRSTYNRGSHSTQPPYKSGYGNNNNAWSSNNNGSNNAWSSTRDYDNGGRSDNNPYYNSSTWSSNSTYSNNAAWSSNSSYNSNGAQSSNSSYNSNSAWSNNSNNSWSGSYSDNGGTGSGSSTSRPNQTAGYSSYGESANRGYTGKSLEGSAVKDPDPLDMSEEAKAERWFRRAAQIKDISELANIPDEDFPEIMPMRKGVNRFVVSKRKTPLERRLTSPQYRRNLPICNSEELKHQGHSLQQFCDNKPAQDEGPSARSSKPYPSGHTHSPTPTPRRRRHHRSCAASRTELCRFSGQKIYPGKGIRFIRADSQVFLFANSKCKRYFHNRLKPAKLTWTAMYRKQHKKDIHAEAVKKRRRTTKKPYSRSIVGATLEVIQKKRSEKPEVRDAAREAALREIKERIKKTKDEKKAKKAEVAKSQKTQSKGGATQRGAKGPKIGGGGGKR